jgi:hypothetical protein
MDQRINFGTPTIARSRPADFEADVPLVMCTVRSFQKVMVKEVPLRRNVAPVAVLLSTATDEDKLVEGGCQGA